MRDYQRKKSKYKLPGTTYKQTLNIIRDYDRMKDEADKILKESPPPPDGQPKGQGHNSSDVERKVLRRIKYIEKINIIDKAKEKIPTEYMTGVWNNIVHDIPYPCDAHKRTYSNYKYKFIYAIAKELFILD